MASRFWSCVVCDETPVSGSGLRYVLDSASAPGRVCDCRVRQPQARLRADCASLWADSVPPTDRGRIVWFCLISFLAFKFWLLRPQRRRGARHGSGHRVVIGAWSCRATTPTIFSLRFITVSYSTCNATRVEISTSGSRPRGGPVETQTSGSLDRTVCVRERLSQPARSSWGACSLPQISRAHLSHTWADPLPDYSR